MGWCTVLPPAAGEDEVVRDVMSQQVVHTRIDGRRKAARRHAFFCVCREQQRANGIAWAATARMVSHPSEEPQSCGSNRVEGTPCDCETVKPEDDRSNAKGALSTGSCPSGVALKYQPWKCR